MSRIILTVSGVGKTYTDVHFKNVYDFDKHTLDYKYYRDGFEHLNDEQFKGQPNRKIREGWFDKYMTDWCRVIDSGQYEIVLGWLNMDCVLYLLDKGYHIEVVLIDPDSDMNYYSDRLKNRGNSENSVRNVINSYEHNCDRYLPMMDKFTSLYKISNKTSLVELLLFSGSSLVDFDNNILTSDNLDKNKIKTIRKDATPL